jgi:hypothetical protein
LGDVVRVDTSQSFAMVVFQEWHRDVLKELSDFCERRSTVEGVTATDSFSELGILCCDEQAPRTERHVLHPSAHSFIAVRQLLALTLLVQFSETIQYNSDKQRL